MASGRVTLADVARRAGLSETAASLILNDRPDTRLSADAVARVRAAAAELGYRPNAAARTLSTNKSHSIGFISDVVATTRFAGSLIRGALAEARDRGHILLIAETGGAGPGEIEAAESLLDRQADGIIYAAMKSREVTLPDITLRSRVVMLNATSAAGHVAVLPDEFEAGRRIASMVLDAGFADGLAILGSKPTEGPDPAATVTVRRRLDGIRSVLSERRVTPVAEVHCAVWDADEGYTGAIQLLADQPQLRALICLNDPIAFGAYRAIAEHGLNVPEDISVASFDDDEIALYLSPQLTTAALPYEEMGRLAVRLLLGDEEPTGEYLVEMPIRTRGSIRQV